MYGLRNYLDIGGLEAAENSQVRDKTSPFKSLEKRRGLDSRALRELAPFLQFISRKQLARLRANRLPVLGIPPPRSLDIW